MVEKTLKEMIFLSVAEFEGGVVENTLFEDVHKKMLSYFCNECGDCWAQQQDWNSLAYQIVGVEEI